MQNQPARVNQPLQAGKLDIDNIADLLRLQRIED